ncbi:MAG: glycosyltransferase family 2 protein [Acidobacteria bacterium]|nr:glycosyltransferase family 2 protein [Acidobacteriota bacterium]
MRVTAIIPNWNRRDLLAGVIEDLRGQSMALEEIVVVDNGSSDGSVEAAASAGARVIRLAANRGFSHAVNAGLRAAATDWVAVLNNDVRLPATWLETLLPAVAGEDCWFGAGKLLTASNPKRVDGAFDLLCRGGCAWRAGHGSADCSVWSRTRRVHFVPFTAAVFRRELFERVGYLDEEFESYLEDVEFGLRCALAGFCGLYVPEATGLHHGSATLGEWSRETVRRLARNQLLLVAKHYPPDWIIRYGWQVLIAQLLWGALAVRHGTGMAYLQGKYQALGRLWRSRRRQHTRLEDVLSCSEQEILELQKQAGSDLFWRLYFSLT